MKAGFLLVGSLVIAASLWVSGVFTTPASTLLIIGATAKPTLEGHVAAVFDIENQGAPDELLSVSSTMATATIAQAGDSLPVRTGTSSLAMDAAAQGCGVGRADHDREFCILRGAPKCAPSPGHRAWAYLFGRNEIGPPLRRDV